MDVKENKFTIAEDLNGKIHVVEPGWDALPDADKDGVPDAATNMAPMASVLKDPAVSNEAEIPVWAFAQVKVPTANVKILNEDGTSPETASMNELFEMEMTADSGWVEVFENPTFDADQPASAENPRYVTTGTAKVIDGYTVHTYVQTTQLAGTTTDTATKTKNIFDKVTLRNLVEAQGTSGAQDIIVGGFGIQVTGFDNAYEGFNAYGIAWDGSDIPEVTDTPTEP